VETTLVSSDRRFDRCYPAYGHAASCVRDGADRVWQASTRRKQAGGFTLVEVVISSVVVALMLVAALTTLGTVARDYGMTREYQVGRLLGETLMGEILQQAYVDVNDPSGFGVEAGEGTATRVDFDDVDDYDGWSSNPPEGKDGSGVAGADGWTRSVTVRWADVLDPGTDMGSDSGLKRIEVSVTNSQGKQYAVKALRSSTGTLALQPPLDRTYVTGVQAELQAGADESISSERVSIGNHAEDL
jgi:MSHA pilin protein MshD